MQGSHTILCLLPKSPRKEKIRRGDSQSPLEMLKPWFFFTYMCHSLLNIFTVHPPTNWFTTHPVFKNLFQNGFSLPFLYINHYITLIIFQVENDSNFCCVNLFCNGRLNANYHELYVGQNNLNHYGFAQIPSKNFTREIFILISLIHNISLTKHRFTLFIF